MENTASPSSVTVPSTCWECGTCCGALLTVQAGRVVEVAPNRDNPWSRGAFCIKGIRGATGIAYHPDRLLRPRRRVGPRGSGRWRDISWDEALDEMADRLAEVRAAHGPLAIAGAVSNAWYSRGLTVALLMRSIGSPNWLINQDLCGGCRATSDRITGLGIGGGEDIDHARMALIVGRNPYAADPVQWQALKAGRKRGMRVVVIDPKRTPAVDLADLWLRPKPGTDSAIALALSHHLIAHGLYDRDVVARDCHGFKDFASRAAEFPPERAAAISGVPAEDIVRAAELYADGPSTFVSGHGIDANSRGVETYRAFHCLVAIAGNVDRTGGNRRARGPKGFRTYLGLLHHPDFRLAPETERQTLGADRFPLWSGPDSWHMACHNPTAIEAMLTGRPYPLRALYVSGVNIAVTYPDSRRTLAALNSLDFLAVATHMMTPTAEVADIVLPKTTTIEEEEVSLMASAQVALYTAAAVPPVGEARSDLYIAIGLIDRLDARGALQRNLFQWRTQEDFNRFLIGDSGIDLAELRRAGFARYTPADPPPRSTPTGKIELYCERLAALRLDPLPNWTPREAAPDATFPFALLTGDREKSYHHSRFREQSWATKVSPDPRLLINPADAGRLGMADGDWVSLETPAAVGACRLRLSVTENTPEGVLSTGMGWWRPEAPAPERGALDININAALTYGAPWDPVSGSADTRGLRCRIAPAS
jgi:anaerobic selenocysteine-containing dehydrogenase